MTKQKNPADRKPQPLPDRLINGLSDVDIYISQERWSEAQELLLDLDRRYPEQPEVLALLAHVYIQQKNWMGFLYAGEFLAERDPDDLELRLALIGAYLYNGFPASALLLGRQVAQHWPGQEGSGDIAKTIADLEPELQRRYDQGSETLLDREQKPVSFVRWLEWLRESEAVQMLLHQRRYRKAIARGEAVLKDAVDFAPLLNSLSEAYWWNAQDEKAIDLAQRAAILAPLDAGILQNQAILLLLSGKIEDALACAEQLKAIALSNPVNAAKTMEVVAQLGDHEMVLGAFEWLQEQDVLGEWGPGAGFLYHLAAAAQAHLGRQEEARRLWQNALQIDPDLEIAQENLEDLDRAVGEQNGPYADILYRWLSPKAQHDLEREMQTTARENRTALDRSLRRWAARHEEVNLIAPFILRLGSSTAREFILSVAAATQSPRLLEAVRDFALGQAGSDEMRLGAAKQAAHAGLLPTGMHRVWLKGQWTDTLVMGIELSAAIERKHASKVEKWLKAALGSAREGQYKQAEILLRQALELEPEAPDLLFNLAAACQNQGSFAESEALLEQVAVLSPEYPLAGASLAQLCISRGDLERGRQLLAPLRLLRQMNYSEFDALCAAHIELHLAEKDQKSAQAWYGVWKSVDAQNPRLERYQRLAIG